MPLVLSDADLAGLAAAQEALLSPLACEPPAAWQTAVRREVRSLLGAYKSISVLPLGDGQHILPDPEEEKAVGEYIAYYHQCDPGVTTRRRELGLEVAELADIYDMRRFFHSELMTDWGGPHGL